MRFPFVSRAHYELLEHNYGEMRTELGKQRDGYAAHVDSTVAALKSEMARYDALLSKYHALKLQGAVIVGPPVPIERKEQDEVMRRVNILSVGKPGLRAQMLRQVESDRKLHGMNDVEIMQRIEAGVTRDEGVIA